MINLLLRAAIAPLLFSLAWAQTPQARLEAHLSDIQDETGLIAVAAGVMVEGEVVAMAATGRRAIDSDQPVTAEGPWHIGSITKSMTALLMGTLVDDGLIGWDTTVTEVFGEGVDPAWGEVTLTHLLTHRSGAPSNFPVLAMINRGPAEGPGVRARRFEAVMDVLSEPPEGPVGDFRYSNIGFTIAGAMAEQVTDTSYNELLQARIFDPLEVTVGFGAPQGEDAPWGHRKALFGKARVNPMSAASDNPAYITPAGTVHLPLSGLLAYGQMRISGEPAVVSQETLDRLHSRPWPDAAESPDYGYGVMREEDGRGWGAGPLLWHNGSNTAWYALLVMLPEVETVMVIVTNDGDTGAAQPAFFELAAALVEELELKAE